MNSDKRNLVGEFAEQAENTMNAYTVASVCKLISELAKIPLSKKDNNIDFIIAKLASVLEQYAKDDPELKEWKAVIEFIKSRLDESTNKFDNGTYYDSEQQQMCSIKLSLKEVFALVCREIFSKDDPWHNDDDGEAWKEGLKDRIKILYACFLDLRQDDFKGHLRCHKGAQHELAMVLCGIHPLADNIIIHFPSFLHKKAAEYLIDIFKQKNLAEQFKFVRNVIYDEVVVLDDRGLESYLKNVCAECGLDITNSIIKQEINTVLISKQNILFIDNIPNIAIHIYHLRELKDFLDSYYDDKVKNSAIIIAKKILQECESFADLQNSGLIDLLAADEIIKNIQEFQPFLSYCEPEERDGIKVEISKIEQQIVEYYENFASNRHMQFSTQRHVEEFKNKLSMLEKKIRTYDVVNFFKLLNNIHDTKSILQLRESIEAKKQLIIFTDDEDLIRVFSVRDKHDNMVLSSYDVNRVLLHAILVPLDSWSRVFSVNLALTLEFLKKLKTKNIITNDLQKSSYPKQLLDLLQALDAEFTSTQIDNVQDLGKLLQLLAQQNQVIILQRLADTLDSIICDITDLEALLCQLLEQDRLAVLEQLGGALLAAIIQKADNLSVVLDLLSEQNKPLFIIQLIGEGCIEEICKDKEELAGVLDASTKLSEQDKLEILEECFKSNFGMDL